MQRPPRDPQERLFNLKSVSFAILQGGIALAVCVTVFLFARPTHGHDAARALTFTALVVSFLAVILTNRSWTVSLRRCMRNPNPALWWVLGGTSAFLALVLSWPVAQRLFRFAPLHASDLLLAGVAGFASILWFEIVKAMRHRRRTVEQG